jgi:general secretion pathway protein G
MTSQDFQQDKCPQCSAKVLPSMRYCMSCYAPLAGRTTTRAHLELVKDTATTHRHDPTVIFLPEEHEAIIHRKTRRHRFLIAGAVAFALIAAVCLSLYLWSRDDLDKTRAMAREQAAVSELNMLAEAVERFRVDMGRYPSSEEGIQCLTNKSKVSKPDNGADMGFWNGPYVKGVYEVDPWGNDYIYRVIDNGQAFELFSYGPEAEAGTRIRLHITSRR